jgi:hypothetical protein
MPRFATLCLILLAGCSDELVERAAIEEAKAERVRASAIAAAKEGVESETKRLLEEFEQLRKTDAASADRGPKYIQAVLEQPIKGSELEEYQYYHGELKGKSAAQFIAEQDAKAAAQRR